MVGKTSETAPLALVLLAAGASRRFGENKLLYPINGKPMYRYMADMGENMGDVFQEKIVVTGYDEIIRDLSARNWTVVENREPEAGISRSVALGVKAARERLLQGAICFAVCDQPYLTEATCRKFLREWSGSGYGLGSLAFGEQEGNPAVFSDRYWEELEHLTGDRGGRQVLRRHREDVFFYQASDARELKDMDRKL